MNRRTGIGRIWRQRPEGAVDEIRAALEYVDGNIVRCASVLFVSRRHLYRLVDRANLWPEVAALRRQRHETKSDVPDDIRRALAIL